MEEAEEAAENVEQAANAHKVEPGQIVKTIALALDKPILLMTAGDVKIDNNATIATLPWMISDLLSRSMDTSEVHRSLKL